MSDLISRKALLKKFYEHTNGGKQRYLIPEEIWEMVELEPTAYDPDKIVEQLGKHSFEWDNAIDYIETLVAMEIVKSGGAE